MPLDPVSAAEKSRDPRTLETGQLPHLLPHPCRPQWPPAAVFTGPELSWGSSSVSSICCGFVVRLVRCARQIDNRSKPWSLRLSFGQCSRSQVNRVLGSGRDLGDWVCVCVCGVYSPSRSTGADARPPDMRADRPGPTVITWSIISLPACSLAFSCAL